jgi:3-oxoacyl-[acyl-carrier-protein] synthase II
MKRRVVITGLGAVTALGSTLAQYWEGLLQGRSGIRRITQFDASALPCQIAGEIPDFDPDQYMERKEARRVPRSAQIALASAMQAVADAGLPDPLPDQERSSVVFGTAIGGLDKFDEGIHTLRTLGYDRVNPFTVPAGIPNLSAFMIARQFQCLGPNSTIVTACATGTQAVGEAPSSSGGMWPISWSPAGQKR